MMTHVLQVLRHTDIVASDAHLESYMQRCMARPACKRALDAQLREYEQAA